MSKQGFTLIELSIVLVIIGLIVGGILVGQDLIKAAEIRGTISQIEKYQTSVNTFRNKYGYIPGDMPPARSTQLGFFALDVPPGGGVNAQDGNGVVSAGFFASAEGEVLVFWRHLTDAQMIDGSFGTDASGNPLDPATGQPSNLPIEAGGIRAVIPPTRLGRGTHFQVLANIFGDTQGINMMRLSGFSQIDAGALIARAPAITPLEAQEIDRKMDDGLPGTGKVRGNDLIATCLAGTQYDIQGATGNTPGCELMFRGVF